MSDQRSQWPDEPKDYDVKSVDLIFEPAVYVNFETPKSIGLTADVFARDDIQWIPRSVITGEMPDKGDWIETLEVTKWFADKNELDYKWE